MMLNCAGHKVVRFFTFAVLLNYLMNFDTAWRELEEIMLLLLLLV